MCLDFCSYQLQAWPQFRFGKIVWAGWYKKETIRSVKEKAFLDREIASVEPLVESFFQCHITIAPNKTRVGRGVRGVAAFGFMRTMDDE